ncbi:hypothetical protein BC826DRAFT_968520 [Russula brevipes]|nr:hypothetical protein BC826DRAFT_968520 [Russula brevipes]
MSVNADSDHLFDSTRRPYIRPAAVWVDCSPVPQHWDLLTSEIKDLDISEEDGYVLSANGEGSASGVFVPFFLEPPDPRSPPSYYSLDAQHGLQGPLQQPPAARCNPAAKFAPAEVSPTLLISPPASPAVSRTPPFVRQQRPELHVQTSSPVGTSAPPYSIVALSQPSPSQFRPSGRLPKRSILPVGPPNIIPVPWLFDRLVRSPPSSHLALVLSWDAVHRRFP